MISFSSYFPMASFLKIELEFDDENITQKFKSLTAEGENEIPYSKIANIQFERRADMRWTTTGFIFILLDGLFISVLFNLFPQLCGNPIVYGIGQFLFLVGIGICLLGFVKRDFCYFYDKDSNYITVIEITNKNSDAVYKAIELIKNKTSIISETDPDLLDEDENPKLELTTHFFPNYLYKNTIRFYDDKILDVEKNLFSESASEYQYDTLKQKVTILKLGDNNWNSLAFFIIFVGLILSTGFDLFFPNVSLGMEFIFGAVGLSIFPFIMRYAKRETIFFYDKNDDVVFYIKIPRNGKQKVEEIIQFIKMKTPEASYDSISPTLE